ncbi:hypothetical protein [Amycolatopsis lexingtonensis]|uniref:hypothetical protein n=1 Tax=Amycolatopsis lexingtonensis TaxID=218822 RepID=UPI003F6F13E8
MSALEEILPDIKRAAARVGREWSSITTAEDIEQEMLLHLLEKDTALRLAEFDHAARSVTLYRIGTQIASQERIDFDHFMGNFLYSTRDVRQILERGALHEEREKTHTERLDLDEGIAQLRERNPRYAELIGKRYLLGEVVPEKMALSRAVDALTEAMNNVNSSRARSYTDGPGSRQVVSNAEAANITRRQMEK